MRNKNFITGLVKDEYDKRDIFLGKYMIARVLPSVISWRDKNIPILDQGSLGACVGFSSSAMKMTQERIEHNKVFLFDGEWLYYECKKIDGLPNIEGTYIRTALKILKNTGFKYKNNYFKIKAYVSIKSLKELKYALVTCGPIVIGVNVYKNWFSTKNGVIQRTSGKCQGGHAICIVGYDDNKELIQFANSWGEKWGHSGYGYLGYDYFKKECISAWSVIDIDDIHLKLNCSQLVKDIKEI